LKTLQYSLVVVLAFSLVFVFSNYAKAADLGCFGDIDGDGCWDQYEPGECSPCCVGCCPTASGGVPECYCDSRYNDCVSCQPETAICRFSAGDPCGDGYCDYIGGEDCNSCAQDCGSCGGGGPSCGNFILEGSEECDDGYSNGPSPAYCSSTCTLNTLPATCGDGNIDSGEVCDIGDPSSGIPPNLNGESCQSQGYPSGTLQCSTDCLSFDTSSCSGGGSCTDNAAVESTTMPSSITLSPGQVYNFNVALRNTGDTRWYHGDGYRFVQTTGITLLCGTNSYCHLPFVADTNDVPSWTGVKITAPSTPGTYPFQMRMVHIAYWDSQTSGGWCGNAPVSDTYFGATLSTTINVVQNDPPFGSIDYPNGDTLKGTVFPTGWALDDINNVAYVNVQFRGPTNLDYTTSTCITNTLICNTYSTGSSYAACGGNRCNAGWSATVDTLALSPGSYQVSAYACDTVGKCGYLTVSPRTATVDQCYQVSCTAPPSNTCATSTSRNVYNPAGTCNSANGVCSYTSSVVACGPSQACVNGVCVDPCGGVTCGSPPSNYCSVNVLTNYTNPGTCVSPGGVPTCDYNPTPITCTLPDDICIGNTLRDYTSASCSVNQCAASYTDVACSYGCLSQAGNDACAANPAPTLTSIAASPSIVMFGDLITVMSVGSDPGGELVRLRCGTTSGGTNLCTSGYVASNPSCSGSNTFWSDSAVHTIYCFLQDNGATPASSSVLSTTITTDNTNPTASVSINDSRSPIPANTPVTLTANANDANGISTVRIFVDSSLVKTCNSSPCNYIFTPAYGVHSYYVIANDIVNNMFTTPASSFTINNAPSVSPITYTGTCATGNTITLNCNAADPNQAANTLSVKTWAGQCDGANCFATRSWTTGTGTTYANNVAMTAPGSGGQFTLPITITQPSGTAVAATCQATDALNAWSTFGDAYPLCVVDGCQNPPVITVNSVVPSPAKAGNVRITFTSDRTLVDYPSVVIMPGSQSGGTTDYPATFISKNGNTYVYDVTVSQGYANGIADIRISATGSTDSCPASQINQFTIDTAPPSTSILCNGAACTSSVYRPSATVTFSCSDATTSCANTYFTVNGGVQQTYSQASPPMFSVTGVYNINYWSTDTAGNLEGANSRTVQVYTGNEQAVVQIISLQPKTVLLGQTVNGNISCFLKDTTTNQLTRMCNVNQNGINIIIDRSTAKQKDYFSTLGVTRTAFLSINLVNTAQNVVVGGQSYAITKHWRVPLDTNIFSSEICVNMTDFDSGLSGEMCDNYTVSNSQLLPEITFPDVAALVIPTTSSGAPNFTKTMSINFNAVIGIQTGLSTSPCTDVSCRVEYSFIPFAQWDPITNPPLVASWSGFANAYAPTPSDASSNYFTCDQYKTLYVRATKQGGSDNGITAETQKDFFINCNTRVTITPYEKRMVLGAQPGTVFDVTIWNPKEGSDRTFNVQPLVPDAYVLSWINFQCPVGQSGCSVDSVNDDMATLVVPQVSSRTIQVAMPSAVRSGAYSVTFVATENSVQYSTLGVLLIFVEGLDEFAVWQLAGLFVIAAGIFAYSRNDVKVRKRR